MTQEKMIALKYCIGDFDVGASGVPRIHFSEHLWEYCNDEFSFGPDLGYHKPYKEILIKEAKESGYPIKFKEEVWLRVDKPSGKRPVVYCLTCEDEDYNESFDSPEEIVERLLDYTESESVFLFKRLDVYELVHTTDQGEYLPAEG